MTVLYIASDQPGAGKTALCTTLAHKLAQQGKSTAVFKPIAKADGEGDSDPDGHVYKRLLGQKVDGWPGSPPSKGLTAAAVKEIKATFKGVSKGKDVVIVEGSSALSDSDANRLATSLDASAVVVTRYQPGLDTDRLAHWREVFGDRLAGFVINGLTRYQGTEARTSVLPALESAGMVSLGIIPEDRRLLAVTVEEVAAHLDGRFITCAEKADNLVEHFLIGGWTMDAGELYFGLHENKAVITRGDRPDMQMACLATPTACLVATKGVEPIEYVIYEAKEEEVPVIVVEADTLATMDALNSVYKRARFDHPAKLARFSELLDEHMDLGALYATLGVAG